MINARRLLASYLVLSAFTSGGVLFLLMSRAVTSTDGGGFLLQGLAQAGPMLVFVIVTKVFRVQVDWAKLCLPGLVIQAVACGSYVAFGVPGYHSTYDAVLGAALVFGAIMSAPTCQSLLTELAPADSQVKFLSRVSSFSNAGMLLGPIAASTLWARDLSAAVFWSRGVLMCLAVLVVLHARQTTNRALFSGGSIQDETDDPAGAGTAAAASDHSDDGNSPQGAGVTPSGHGGRGAWREQLALIGPFCVVCVFGYNIQTFAPILVMATGSTNPEVIGWVVSGHTLGGIVGAYAVGKLPQSLNMIVVTGATVLGVLLVVASASPTVTLLVAVIALAGVGRGLVNTSVTVRNSLYFADSVLRERLLAVTTILFASSNVISLPLMALVVNTAGSRFMVAAFGVATVLAGALEWWFHHRGLPRAPELQE